MIVKYISRVVNISNLPWLPSIAWDDSNEVLKRVFSLNFSLMSKVCWDSQTLAFRGPAGPSRPMPCPCGHALLKEPILNLHYNFDFKNSPWKWGTMAPEGHGVQVLPDPDLTYPHWVGGAQQHLFNKVFTKIHSWGSRTPLGPPFPPWTPGCPTSPNSYW